MRATSLNEPLIPLLLGLLVVLLFLSAFFSGSETALMTLNRYRIKHLVKQKHPGAIRAWRLIKRPDRLFGLILIGNTVANIFASAVTALIAIELVGVQAVVPTIVILALVVVIFSEVMPKTLGARRSEKLVLFSAWVYRPLIRLFYPLVWLVNSVAGGILKLFGVDSQPIAADTPNHEELRAMMSEVGQLLPDRYQSMLLSIMDLESARVEDIMTQRNAIVGIDLEDPLEEIIQQIQTIRHHCVPVYKQNIDRVIGFLSLQPALARLSTGSFDKDTLEDLLSKPLFIASSTSLYNQMQAFKAEKRRIGIVVDEYGDVQGLVTMNDLLQSALGELIDEQPTIKAQKDGSYLVDASISIRELNRTNHWELPTDGPKTLNGLIIEHMETIPESGTSIKLASGYILEVLHRDGNTVKLVRIYAQH